ncbi:cobaltochelatase subunit CobN [Knoellia sinensis KCTC 19936]|uniref:Cobaltochelatase subunit CobN n=1 Tax=Knoellia sinensis KCTC 19936 TaxID=1385520 RepID=A0A0A0J8I4_9MICO|nr:cobaltochelatase subunit CobN [Knoellia sinensis]KGN31936.1 cobaltochelatase subunit CobN [Knoellia sinensis KCTC 19936]
MPRIAILSTSDTDLLCARASGADYTWANPSRSGALAVGAALEGAEIVIARILGSPQDLPDALADVRERGVPLVVLGGEQAPNAALMAESTAPSGVVHEAHRYLAQGGADNLRELHGFLSDTLLLSGDTFEPPVELPRWGTLDRPSAAAADTAASPRVAILFYRAQFAAGNTDFAHALADAVDAAGGVGVPVWATSLRDAPEDLLTHLGTYDAIVTTVLAAGGTRPATASAGEDDDAWNVAALAALDVPILQGLCLTWSRDEWAQSDDGMSPLDVATQVAVPEFDGRLITVAFSFKETDSDGLPHYVADPERCARVAGIAVGHARLRHTPPAERRIAIVLSAYPTKHSRIGNAVGLDTPVSTIRLLRAMREAGYDLGTPGGIPGLDGVEPRDGEALDTTAGNALVHALIAAGGQDPEWLTDGQLTEHHVRIPASRYAGWFASLPSDLRDGMTEAWGEAPGELFVDHAEAASGGEAEIVSAALQSGNVVLLVQPPRGFGENPIAIYHDPDLAPTHHYIATYRWIEEEFGAHAIVHMGKHGNLEWLPGKNLALSAGCGSDAALGSVPLIYPFLVNDPGEGTQAKRRAHATIVDHLVPPMARAESYGDIARLEQLLDEYGNVSVMDPAKAPALQGEIWTLLQAAKLDQDLGLTDRPDEEGFDALVGEIDYWLCAVKDVQIRDGLHILGEAPSGEALDNLVLAILRAGQVFAGQRDGIPGLRTALGLDDVGASTSETDAAEETAKRLVSALSAAEWDGAAVPEIVAAELGGPNHGVEASLRFACDEVVPRLARTVDEIPMVLHALDGGYVPAGPSGSPLRGLVNVLPTGRNFYSVDPKAIPSRLAYETGVAMAESLLQRYLDEEGELPRSVGLSAWGTSAMRTSGDDIGEVLALLGVTPVWDEQSRRVVGLEAIPLAELGRPRIDVTVRISGFFRDAFPHVINLLDDAVALVVGLDEPLDQNFPKAHATADLETHGDERRSRTRVFGSKPGSYGAGILQVVESGTWRDEKDLAEVYTAWGGFAYGRDLDGAPARDDMERNYTRIQVAAKNVDNVESDILDSDDFFQYHGGMVATVRALTGASPAAYVGDSTTPANVRTRTLQEETNRVFRARVVNPRWISAMQRHGYKGAFELAATVDYLFGFDATAGVVPDWMYDRIAHDYVLDKTNQDFMRHANPWALRGIVEKLSEAADRGLWAEPDPEVMDQMRQVYLDIEGDLEE